MEFVVCCVVMWFDHVLRSLLAIDKAMTSWLRRMRDYDASITLFGSPWSPPQWMKLSSNNTIDTQRYADAWARYMLHYLQAFAEQGVRVDALTPQNEPLHSSDPAWTTSVSAADEATLINALAPMLQSAGLNQTGIWAYDHNTDRPDYPDTVLAQAGQHVQAVAWHCYSTTGAWQVNNYTDV
jgi:glucosylceramidase